jgi:hypothetical protein
MHIRRETLLQPMSAGAYWKACLMMKGRLEEGASLQVFVDLMKKIPKAIISLS